MIAAFRSSRRRAVLIAASITLASMLAVQHASGAPVAAISLDGYRHWKRVNEHLVAMTPQIVTYCAALITPSPHDVAAYHVYVNPSGEKEMLTKRRPSFPVDSVLVKEKYTQPDLIHPSLLTVMRKREAGFDPPHGNWEFLVREGRDNPLVKPKDVAECRDCHTQVRSTDFVFRDYLPSALQKKLR